MPFNTDFRLTPAFEAISSGAIQLLSLDIFDTLLWRTVPKPSDLFIMLGQELKEKGWLIEALTPLCFAELRIKSEQIVRNKKAKINNTQIAEITLQEIYWQMHALFRKISIEEMIEGKLGIISESDVDQPVAFEVDFEQRITQFDENIVSLIRFAKQKNVPVILISDTYFELTQLNQILERNVPEYAAHILQCIQNIYSSCEYGVGKRHGLFSIILDEFKIDPKSILHVGDNYESDFESAKKLYINTLFFPKYNREFSEIIQREWFPEEGHSGNEMNPDLILQKHLQSLMPQLDAQFGDFGITSLRSKLFFDKHLQQLTKEDCFFWKYGATVLGPVLTGFVHWIYERCKDMKQQQVLCLMREGRLYGDLIRQYAPFYPQHKLEAKEVWTSRQFIMRACIRFGTPEELYAMQNTHPAEPFTVGLFINTLGLDLKKIPKYLKYENVKLLEDNFRDELMQYLSEQSHLREKIIETSTVKRKNFIKYLSKVVDLSAVDQLTFVDVGWIGTIQSAVQVMLQMEGYAITIHGLYLGTNYKSAYGLLQGSVREGYLLNGGYPYSEAQVIQKGLYVLEQSAIPNVGSLLDIDVDGNIINGTSKIPKKQTHQVQIVQEGIRAFCDKFGKARLSQAIIWDGTSEKAKGILRKILTRANGFPTYQEANGFAAWHHDLMITQLVSQQTEYIAIGQNNYYERFAEDLIASLNDWSMIWPASYAAKHDKYAALAYMTIRGGKLPRECILSHDSIPLRIFLDTGKGYPKKATKKLLLHSSPSRSYCAYENLYSIKKPIRKMHFELMCADSLVRIKSLRISIDRYSHSKQITQVFFESESDSLDGIEILNSQKLSWNTFACKDHPFALTYAFQDPDVYSIQLRLICETFSMK